MSHSKELEKEKTKPKFSRWRKLKKKNQGINEIVAKKTIKKISDSKKCFKKVKLPRKNRETPQLT